MTTAPASCRAFPLRTDLADAGSFSCSNERLNRIQEICRNTFLAGVMTVQSDCPHRERFAYGGDIVGTSEAFLMNFDMEGFYRKTVRDWADAARAGPVTGPARARQGQLIGTGRLFRALPVLRTSRRSPQRGLRC